MAATKGKSTSAKKKTGSKKETQKARASRNRMGSIVLFALGAFLTALSFVQGENVWLWLHGCLFGIFGLCAYGVGPLIIYISVVRGLGRDINGAKLWQAVLLAVFVCGAFLIFGGSIGGGTLWQEISSLYITGSAHEGGGALAFVTGYPLLRWFGRPGADITIVLLMAVFLMLVTGNTVVDIFNSIRNAVERGRDRIEEAAQSFGDSGVEPLPRRERVERPAPLPTDNGKKKSIDIPISYPEPVPQPEPLPAEEEIKPRTRSKIDIDLEPVKIPVPPSPEEDEDIFADFRHSEKNLPVQTELPVREYTAPPIELLDRRGRSSADATQEAEQVGKQLVSVLSSFGVQTKVLNISRGPAVTRYELQPAVGVKISKITGLADDIALNLAASGVRIEAPIPGKAAVGIEVPNRNTTSVTMRDLIESAEYKKSRSSLTFSLGRDIAGSAVVSDVATMPHLLIAGATGSGKSVFINSLILSIIYKSSPEEVRMILIDPKVVELGEYNGIPHLWVPVVNDPKKAAGTLSWAVNEMMNRYHLFAEAGCRNLEAYNAVQTEKENRLPRVVIIIDELSDLMMVAPGEVEDYICRLAQMARAAGMHLVVATQRPSVDVITGTIKANIPSRIAFAVSSQVDSRTILDQAGAEKLLGRGDMLFLPVGASKPIRVQGCYVSDNEIEKVTHFLKKSSEADYSEQIISQIDSFSLKDKKSAASSGDDDAMIDSAIECVVENGQASTSLLQRRLKLGYARAARIMDQLEEKGIIGPSEGAKARNVLISRQEWIEMKLRRDSEGVQ